MRMPALNGHILGRPDGARFDPKVTPVRTRPPIFSRLIPLVVVLSTPALAQTYDRSDIVRGLCQPDGCDEFAILGADRVATTEEGSLIRTRLKTFHAS
jgi:hypothetical protein